jgi:hypothetical protein
LKKKFNIFDKYIKRKQTLNRRWSLLSFCQGLFYDSSAALTYLISLVLTETSILALLLHHAAKAFYQ